MNDIITESGYTIKLLDFNDNEESLKKILNLQNIVYEGQHVFHIEPFRNWYLNNPMGKVISFNAFYGDELVAHYACSPYKMLIEGREVLGLFDLATVTHPDHRGKGLFKLLANTNRFCGKTDKRCCHRCRQFRTSLCQRCRYLLYRFLRRL